jgi:hypothetical protein
MYIGKLAEENRTIGGEGGVEKNKQIICRIE